MKSSSDPAKSTKGAHRTMEWHMTNISHSYVGKGKAVPMLN